MATEFYEPPFPGFDQYEGELRYSTHAVKDRMLKDGHTDTDVRMVLASPVSISSSTDPRHPTRFLVEGIGRAGTNLRVVLDHDALRCEFLWVASVFATDAKPVRIKVPARRLWAVWFSLDRLKQMADVHVSRTDKKGRAVVTVVSPIPAFQDEAVEAVTAIVKEE